MWESEAEAVRVEALGWVDVDMAELVVEMMVVVLFSVILVILIFLTGSVAVIVIAALGRDTNSQRL